MGNNVQELLVNLGQLVEIREDAQVFVIVHSKSGLELMSNCNDLVMKLGMLDVARMTVVDIHAQMNAEMKDEIRRIERETVAAMAGKSGQVN